jgi:GntR family transcriptional regulator
VAPDSTEVNASTGPASEQECEKLELIPGDIVIHINRVRTREGRPFIAERIALPEKLFPKLAELPSIPNTLYDLFQKSYGILMMRTDDRLNAVLADADTAAKLGIAEGSPLLRIERTAYALDDKPIEWRTSLCHLENAHYIARTKLSHDNGRKE